MTERFSSPSTRHQKFWRQFSKHRGALIGGIVFAVIVLGVLLGPMIWTLDPGYPDIRARNQGASWAHPLGTDQLGRDTLARLMAGGRSSISVGMMAMILSIGLGCLIGMAAGFFKRLDGPLMRLTDLFLALPLLPLLLVIMMLFREPLGRTIGPQAGIFVLIVFAIGITSWMPTARVVRGEVLALKERDFIRAARAIGATDFTILKQHIAPNILSPIIVSATLGIATAIITESALSFLGLGFPPDFPTWGRQLSDATIYMQDYPGRVFWPGLAISLTVLSVNYLGDGLRDALDPRQRNLRG
ncbi:ABC transporter permease [Roseovarius sp. EL26]|uniref:ABC transporter permease n=1 Tax=Roseovarius sp. EL26 TaxID=2126672 RepID=UPI0020B14B7D|nr:ABC transporter permease [Roseovarius sp. EL26]